MVIRSIAHAGLRRLILNNDASGFSPEVADKLRKMFAFVQAMRADSELAALPTWRTHRLGGNRKGTWALHVTRNYRLTFRIDHNNEVRDVNYEDYH